MARRTPRPGRDLVVFFVVLAGLAGLAAIGGTWKPRLGLDLQGGTRITMRAVGDEVSAESMAEARDIIDDRVNGSGVAEAEVTVQGQDVMVVEVPGESRPELEDTVKRQAQLRFRLVAKSDIGEPSVPIDGQEQPGSGVLLPPDPAPSGSPTTGQPGTGKQSKPSESGNVDRGPGSLSDALKPAVAATSKAGEPSDKPTGGSQPGDKATDQPSDKPAGTGDNLPGAPSDVASLEPTGEATGEAPANPEVGTEVAKQLDWARNPDSESLIAYQKYTCPANGVDEALVDDPKQPLITCDESGVKYLLSPSLIEGEDLRSAEVLSPGSQGQTEWGVTLDIGGDGEKAFADVTSQLAGTGETFAIVLDGVVLSAPRVTTPIVDGRAQITGSFDEASSQSLAASLRFGKLPIKFSDEVRNETIGASLAGNQLTAGLWAGGLGLLIVMAYCLVYYRGLGIVVIASLVIAAVLTYVLVLILSQAAGFTLSLPGIAGLIVAVGITADSFVVFFERIRDEMREGKSMRVAVEAGWSTALGTCIRADTISLLAAVVLYIIGAGVVKGFAFALGVTTLIDLLVFVAFTKPMVSWLARFNFFHSGHALSGLSPETVGYAREGVA